MSEDDSVIFLRGNGDEPCDDVWDDTALITAYDKAIGIAKKEASKRMGVEFKGTGAVPKKTLSHKQTRQSQAPRKWCIGSPCRAVYSEDGEIYEAVVTKIFENTGTCIVTFIGYNNKEKVEISSLLESEGLQSQIAQKKDAAAVEQSTSSMEFESQKVNGFQDHQMDYEVSRDKSLKNMCAPGLSFNPDIGAIPPAPPLPPQLMARLPENDADALSSMLMSWYISGFHTGYYHGLKQARSEQEKRKK
ncbi:survival motor neuron protein [Copidosoma floridanum]|uniref:survival motor neuron protein n=1 Tax=Copidosoma floridanum TaxID=29053 RepID=UPI0006C99246|nr:survival motor neuron protein [Copidosoma floridanum]